MKNTKREFYMCSVAEYEAAEEHLAEMAAKGWLVKNIGLWGYIYKRVEPRRLRFSVDLLTNITALTYPENEDVQDYRALCEQTGWTFACASKQVQIFYTDADNETAIPIQTDDAVKAANIVKMTLKYEAPFIFIGLLLILWNSLGQLAVRGWDVTASNLSLGQIAGGVVFIPALVWYAIYLLRSLWRLRRAAKGEAPMYAMNTHAVRWRTRFFLGSAVLALFLMLVFPLITVSPVLILAIILPGALSLGIGLFIRRQVDTKRRSNEANGGLAIAGMVAALILSYAVAGVLFVGFLNNRTEESAPGLDRPAITLADIGINSASDNSRHWGESSILVTNDNFYESNKEGNLWVAVTRTKIPFLAQRLLDDELAGEEWLRRFSATELTAWQAKDGYVFAEGDDWLQVLVVYDSAFARITISTSGEWSPGDVAAALELR